MGCNYLYMAPAMMVIPLFIISVINTFVAGPPLETLVFDSMNAVALDYMSTKVEESRVSVSVTPSSSVSHYFVFTCYVPESWKSASDKHVPLSAVVKAWDGDKAEGTETLLAHASHTGDGPVQAGAPKEYGLQLLQPLDGYEHYEIDVTAGGLDGSKAAKFPKMEFRLTYVPPRFTQTQIFVRLFFCAVTLLLIIGYCLAMARSESPPDPGQAWIAAILLLLLAVNDPLYAYRVATLGNDTLESAATVGQIVFSAAMFLFWLIMADGMQRSGAKTCLNFYLLKVLIVGAYTASACALFLMHGRIPDRLEVSSFSGTDSVTTSLVVTLIVCLSAICAWLGFLVLRAIYHLGWKNMEYIYTDREKSFVGMTLVFILLWVCGLVYRALHGQRGSWLMLQLPFLALSNSYLVLLVNAFWPGSETTISASIAASGPTVDEAGGSELGGVGGAQKLPKDRQGLLSGEDEDDD